MNAIHDEDMEIGGVSGMTRHSWYAVLGTLALIWAVTLRALTQGSWELALLIVVGLGLVLASGEHSQGRRR